MSLTTFTAHTYANASEVNANFGLLKLNELGSGSGIVQGMELTESATPDLNASLAAGNYIINGTIYSKTSATVTFTNADATNPRWDLVSIDTSGTVTITEGTPASTATVPSLPSGECPIAIVYRPATDNTIREELIFLWRVKPSNPLEWTFVGYMNVQSANEIANLRIPFIEGFTNFKLDFSFDVNGARFRVDEVASNYSYRTQDGTNSTSQPQIILADTTSAVTNGFLQITTNNSTAATFNASVNSEVTTNNNLQSARATGLTLNYMNFFGSSGNIWGYVAVFVMKSIYD